jgi:hypothetical protein
VFVRQCGRYEAAALSWASAFVSGSTHGPRSRPDKLTAHRHCSMTLHARKSATATYVPTETRTGAVERAAKLDPITDAIFLQGSNYCVLGGAPGQC